MSRAAAILGLVAALLAGGAAEARAPARLLVTATEWHLAPSRTVVAHGTVIVQLSNRGQDGHDLVLRRLGRRPTTRRIAETAAGGLTTAHLRLSPGRWRLYCSVPGHRAAGMRATLRVR